MKKQVNIILLIFLTFIANKILAVERFDTINFINQKHEYLSQIIKKNHIKGIAIAFFTSDKIIWKECFGKSTYKNPINDSTLFSIQSMSKNFTALAVMYAVQEGLVDLDSPIKKYLPDFKINSCYEVLPEEKITLRMMLNHTAGFTHEAPIGNNFDFRFRTKQEHWNSICDTWLKFPVNTRYSYSNLGYDLAAKIIENVSGMSFENYAREKIFIQLGMKHSTFDSNDLLPIKNKTEGKIDSYVKEKHYIIPLIGSGAVYSSINDMVKYVQFQMNLGNIEGRQLIEKKYLVEMYTINRNNYGLGTGIDMAKNQEKQLDTYFLNHNGGGFGYGSSMTWFPEYGLGCVILGNKPFDYGNITYNLVFEFICKNENIKNFSLVAGYKPTFKSNEQENPKSEFIYFSNENKTGLGKINISGKYEVLLNGMEFKWYVKILRFFGLKFMTISITTSNNVSIMDGCFGRHELKEYLPGLFFTADGEAFDSRNTTPTFRNIKLRKYAKK